MKIITVDFETYYSREVGFAKQTTEEYIRDPQFHVVGVSVQVDDGEPEWFSGTMVQTADYLNQFDWGNSLALAHNAIFDGAILSWHFNIKPKGWLDTLSMGRALHGTNVGGCLKVLAQYYGICEKGTEVENALGLRRIDFPPEQLVRYGEYCMNDVALTWELFGNMSAGFPQVELRLIDLTIRMFTEPSLALDLQILGDHLESVKDLKVMALGSFAKEDMMSNQKFAIMLQASGATPPMKISPATGRETYAFSKTDEEFKALLEHDSPAVQALVSARLGTKSTIEETRTERFIGIAKRGLMPVP